MTVLGPKSTPPSARIEKWLLYMQQFIYEVKHIPGKANYADVLSRLPLNDIDIHARQTEEYSYCVVKDAVPNALSARQIERASAEDVTLQKISKSITTDEWTNVPGYAAVKHELWLLGELVMRGNRIVIAESLWDQTILAHEGNGSHKVAATREGLVAGHGQTSGQTDSFLPRMSASRAETKADPGEIDCSSRGSMDTPCFRSSGVIGGRSYFGNH